MLLVLVQLILIGRNKALIYRALLWLPKFHDIYGSGTSISAYSQWQFPHFPHGQRGMPESSCSPLFADDLPKPNWGIFSFGSALAPMFAEDFIIASQIVLR